MSAEIENKLYDFACLLNEWIDRYERLGVPRHKLLAQMRTVLINLEDKAGVGRTEKPEQHRDAANVQGDETPRQ